MHQPSADPYTGQQIKDFRACEYILLEHCETSEGGQLRYLALITGVTVFCIRRYTYRTEFHVITYLPSSLC
jgi:hypothetical protein